MFYKSKMKKNVIHSIDTKHSEFIDHFEKEEQETIPKLEAEKDQIKQQMRKQKNVTKCIELQDKIDSINQQIKDIKRKKKKYFLNNSKHLFDYFETKKNISSGEQQNVNVLNTFFKVKNCVENDKPDQSKNPIIQYWKNVNNEIHNPNDFILSADVCMFCNIGEMIPQEDDGIILCNNVNCGKFIPHIMDSSRPLNKEPPHEVSYTSYIRLNHFKEILSQFQAKETTQIPDDVIENIRKRLVKERITNVAQELNYEKMREILRKLGYNKYFEHIQYINSIFGIRPPVMSEELHETLCVLFIELQKPWAMHCPVNRTNFFNYTYTLYQLCVLLDQAQYLPYIPLMKDREKQLEQDQIWKKVCEELDWQYFPTV